MTHARPPIMRDAADLLVVIPARGGSKGLPRKNALQLLDLPLLGWTAESILRSGLRPAACILSTDDQEIAAIGRNSGLDVPFLRPTDIANDTASAHSVALHALDWLRDARDIAADYVMWLQPTSPFRPPQVIAQAYEQLTCDAIDAVVGVKAIHRSPNTLFHMNVDGILSALDPDTTASTRRQDVKALYTPNGAMYIVRAEILRTLQTFFPKTSVGIVMDQLSSLDIDDPTDWAMAEALARAKLTWRN